MHIAVLLIFILVSHISQAVYTIQFCNEHPKPICTPYCKLIIYLTIIKPIRSLTLSDLTYKNRSVCHSAIQIVVKCVCGIIQHISIFSNLNGIGVKTLSVQRPMQCLVH